MSCQFCGVFSRNPCDERDEAAKCPNNPDKGSCLDFDPKEVAAWIRSNSRDEELQAAADLIEERM